MQVAPRTIDTVSHEHRHQLSDVLRAGSIAFEPERAVMDRSDALDRAQHVEQVEIRGPCSCDSPRIAATVRKFDDVQFFPARGIVRDEDFCGVVGAVRNPAVVHLPRKPEPRGKVRYLARAAQTQLQLHRLRDFARCKHFVAAVARIASVRPAERLRAGDGASRPSGRRQAATPPRSTSWARP